MTIPWPEGSGRLIDMPELNRIRMTDYLDDLALTLQSEHGYRFAGNDILKLVPLLPENAVYERQLVRKKPDGSEVLRLGYWLNKSRNPRLGIFRVLISDAGEVTAHPDLGEIETLVQNGLTTVESADNQVVAGDLEAKAIQLSYIDVAGAISALKGLGITTISKESSIPDKLSLEDLPLVVEMLAPPIESTGLVGKTQVGRGQFGATMVPTLASELDKEMIASPTCRLLIMFHPAYPEQYSRVRRLMDELIDIPARQIFIEAMVLEIASGDLEELGIEWEFHDRKFSVYGGDLRPDIQDFTNAGDSLLLNAISTQNLATEWIARIRALIIDGRAEILSRPSVLALNNRQATIRIGEDIPIATSQEGIVSNSSKISFDFKYLSLGILLNIRPRVSADGREVSLMVDTIVSSKKPGGDLEIRDENGRLLASAPGVNTRRVQTYARIQNNTPFIIGGLVSRDERQVTEKVPLLGDIPVIGGLFRSERTQNLRNEVIIVLTPYVLPERLHLSRALPRENKFFDDKDSELFRNSHRILREDTLDVSFLYRNERFMRYRSVAIEAIAKDHRLSAIEPFSYFAEGRLPGERTIVDQILYNTLTRLNLADSVNPERIFLLTNHDSGGYQAANVDDLLAKLGNGTDAASFYEKHPGEAVAISFYDLYETPGGESLASDPVPQIQLVPCPDRAAWTRLLWEMNQPDENNRERYTVLLHRPEDIIRLQYAVLLKSVLHINGGGGPEASLLNFLPGRVIEIPDVSPERVHPVDAEIAKYFFHSSQHFYGKTIQQIEAVLVELESELNE